MKDEAGPHYTSLERKLKMSLHKKKKKKTSAIRFLFELIKGLKGNII